MKSYYNIHNVVKVIVDSDDADLQEGYRHYLRYFKTDTVFTDAHYEVKEFSGFNQSQPSLKASEFSRVKDGVCFLSEQYALTYDGKKITEYTTYANRATNFWIQLLLLKHGLSFVHGAGVEINGKGFIFPAFGGVGKTTLISHLRHTDSFKFFGDDFIMIGKEGQMLSYPSDFSIYDFHVKLFPEIAQMPQGSYLRKRKAFSFVYFIKRLINFAAKKSGLASRPMLRGWVNEYAKVPASALISPGKIGIQTKLYGAIFLERYSGETITSEKMTHDELVKMITSILSLEFKLGTPYFDALTTVTGLSAVDLYKTQKDIISQALSKTVCWRVRLPEHVTAPAYFAFMNTFINSLTNGS